MDDYLKSNRALWDAWTRVHVKSKFYKVDAFKRGENRLDSIVRADVGDVRGKSLLHLQCHFGLDTLSWARLGTRATVPADSKKAWRDGKNWAKNTFHSSCQGNQYGHKS